MDSLEILNLDDFEKSEVIIGKGGFSKVYLVQNKSKEKFVVKELLSQCITRESQKVFFQEIFSYFKLKYPSILSIIGFNLRNFEDSYYPVIMLEYMVNGSLREFLDKHAIERTTTDDNFSSTNLYIILIGTALGMRHAHSQKVVHRDLKPENILLDDKFYPRISDFGCSSITNSNISLHQMKTETGTKKYMAPEIYIKGEYDCTIDVYSFSLIAYELLTGYPPFLQFKTGYQVQDAASKNIRPDVSMIKDKSIQDFLKRCWSLDPKKRPSFKEIVDELLNIKYVEHFKANEEKINEYLSLFDEIFTIKKTETKTSSLPSISNSNSYSKQSTHDDKLKTDSHLLIQAATSSKRAKRSSLNKSASKKYEEQQKALRKRQILDEIPQLNSDAHNDEKDSSRFIRKCQIIDDIQINQESTKRSSRRYQNVDDVQMNQESTKRPARRYQNVDDMQMNQESTDISLIMNQDLYKVHAPEPIKTDPDDDALCQPKSPRNKNIKKNNHHCPKLPDDVEVHRRSPRRKPKPKSELKKIKKDFAIKFLFGNTSSTVKNAINSLDFEVTTDFSEANLIWIDGDFSSCDYFRVDPSKHLNKIPDFHSLCKNSRFFKCLISMQKKYTKIYKDFIPMTYFSPDEFSNFCNTNKEFESIKDQLIWRSKDHSKLIEDPLNFEFTEKSGIIQKLIQPFLIDSHKFILRMYAVISNLEPLTIHFYKDGIACFYDESKNCVPERDDFEYHKKASEVIKIVSKKNPKLLKRIQEIIVLSVYSICQKMKEKVKKACENNDKDFEDKEKIKIAPFGRFINLIGVDIQIDRNGNPFIFGLSGNLDMKGGSKEEKEIEHELIKEQLKLMESLIGNQRHKVDNWTLLFSSNDTPYLPKVPSIPKQDYMSPRKFKIK
ncbi:hypothetical protein M9Y10_010743 [Tritrichomonas musculus]|uniref:Protein kinase domain-containing protein n=1 Tax=Tritrichomonas musculus TaxID=1915356 RepID=A0ABR2ILK4_9EUKA